MAGCDEQFNECLEFLVMLGSWWQIKKPFPYV
jgi:hypothetical protein